VHRDLKPANLFLTHRSDGTPSVKVIDFGLSKILDPRTCETPDTLTRPNDVMGSPHYMAPEQLRASCEADARTDLWALGAVLHELLTGYPPFQGTTMAELCAAVLTQPPESISSLRANVPTPVESAVLRCLEKDPAARFAGTADFAQAVAPYGSASARASCERIERVSGLSPRAQDVSSLPPLSLDPTRDSWPETRELRVRRGPPGEPASAKIVVGALLILSGLGAGTLMGMYASVHANDPVPAPANARAPHPAPPPPVSVAVPAAPSAPPAAAAPAVPGAEPPASVAPATREQVPVSRTTRGQAPVATPAAPLAIPPAAAPRQTPAAPALGEAEPQAPVATPPRAARPPAATRSGPTRRTRQKHAPPRPAEPAPPPDSNDLPFLETLPPAPDESTPPSGPPNDDRVFDERQ
jgi:serine/threonine-protein kinase